MIHFVLLLISVFSARPSCIRREADSEMISSHPFVSSVYCYSICLCHLAVKLFSRLITEDRVHYIVTHVHSLVVLCIQVYLPPIDE